ncbi:MAG: trigger factor [Sulfuricurvum sp. PC08-66]|nr:MAG: trigger factor [Sulfuricurvum sp. PC08-66]
MSVTATKIDGANATVKATISAQMVEASIEKTAKNLGKTAKVDGFRKGKVPVATIKKLYGDKLVQEAEGEALRALLDEGIAKLGLSQKDLIGEPNVTKFEKQADGSIVTEIGIYTRPVIALGDYAALIPEVEKPKITKKAVQERIKELAQAQAPLVKIEEDRGVENGDSVVIDFEGFIDGEAFAGGKAEKFSLSVGSGQFIPGFEEQLLGLKMGEEKSIEVPFPADYQAKNLAGKLSTFKIKLHEIQTKEKVRVDQKLAEKMLPGVEGASVEMLNEKVEEQLASEELSKRYNDELKPSVMEKLVAHYTFDLPAFIVEQEMDNALNRKAQSMTADEIEAIKNDASKLKALRESFREEATKSVKATFIIDQLALAENIRVDMREVEQTIFYEAMQMGQDPQGTLDYYKNAGYLPAVQMAMVEDRLLSKLLDAKIKEVA